MSRTSIGTPCPAPYVVSNLPIPVPRGRLSTTSLGSLSDDTEQIDYTPALQVEFKNARPRRKSTFQPKGKREAAVTIFEDVLEDQELVVENRPHLGGNTLLGKRAQRIPGRGFSRKHESETEVQQQPLEATGQAHRRSSIAVDSTLREAEPELRQHIGEIAHDRMIKQHHNESLKKEPRRRTIFVPPDDTTMFTIHPGANTTDRLEDTFQLSNLSMCHPTAQEKVVQAEGQTAVKPTKRPRMSLAVAPKRIPLQEVAVQASNAPDVDFEGQNGGKENVPPNGKLTHSSSDNKGAANEAHVDRKAPHKSSLFQQTAASRNRRTVASRNAIPLPNCSNSAPKRNTIVTEKPPHTVATVHARNDRRPMPPRATPQHQVSSASETALNETVPKILKPRPKVADRKVCRLQQYPVLSENVAQPELYEDAWLAHQEVALTELVNQIFKQSEPDIQKWQQPKRNLREHLIGLYHQPHVTRLHKRLQASLLYGALSRPRDISRTPDPSHDIGLRRRFLSLWLDSYDQDSLHAAAEVVFGHQLRRETVSSAAVYQSTLDPHKGRRNLISFLETFLVEVEDVEVQDEERGDDPNGRWRNMILRSLMLIWLLDQAKTSLTVHSCLFKRSSPRKSSVSMLYALVGMLIPFIGDITRALRHLEFDVSHVQDPLDEVQYRIHNIAIDLRDGILLTRLVELLLFSPMNTSIADAPYDATVTIQMPDLTILESALYDTEGTQRPRVLSRHLKMPPCLGRAQKVYNMELAISALRDHGRLDDRASNVTAEDIVDGHREKTLSLLWSLVSTHALEQLVNFSELAADIRRMPGNTTDMDVLPKGCDQLTQLQQESLLKNWATAHCGQGGVRIANLTTSFANCEAYTAILAAFAEYMPAKLSANPSSPRTSRRHLETQLQSFGCSTAFTNQLTSTCGTIPSRNTTISNLAFLASRLLPLARQHNAASTIQRAFRRRVERMMVSKRIALLRLAHTCAAIVQTQNKLVSAATVLQRAWRKVLDTRISRLNRDVERFQVVAKAWICRRTANFEVSSALVRSQPSRVMGGW